MKLNDMREARGTSSTTFTKFTRSFKQNPKNLFCFFEGEDSKYYGVRIKQHTDLDTQFFNCKGKEAVLRVSDLIFNEDKYNDACCTFYIDKDFDPSYEDHTGYVYETPCYSIENFYVNISTFEDILNSEFNLHSPDTDFENIISLFQKRQEEFHNSILLFNAWIACQRDLSNKGSHSRLNLKDVKLDKFVDINLDYIQQKYDLNFIEKQFSDANKVPLTDLNKKIDFFKGRDPEIIFRGKFEIEFLRKILEKLIEDRNSKTPKYFSEREKISLNISKKNIISELSQYAITHKSLKDFIKKFNFKTPISKSS